MLLKKLSKFVIKTNGTFSERRLSMFFDPEKVPGVGQVFLITINQSKDFREEHDKLFEDVEGLSRIYCAVHAEFLDAYRIWSIYGRPYTGNTVHLNSRERGVPVDLLALWTEVLTIRTVRLTDKSTRHEPVSVFQFLALDLDVNLKKEIKDLIKIAEDKTEPLRTARDQLFAHKDFDVVDGEIDIQDLEFTIHDIADILESIGNILMYIYNYYAKSSTGISFRPGYSPDHKIKY